MERVAVVSVSVTSASLGIIIASPIRWLRLLLLMLFSSCSTPLDRSARSGPFVLRLLELWSR